MVKVQLGKSGGFVNVKDTCSHDKLNTVKSGVYDYVRCTICGKVIGELEIQGKGKKSS